MGIGENVIAAFCAALEVLIPQQMELATI